MSEPLSLNDFAKLMETQMQANVLEQIDMLKAQEEMLKLICPEGLEPWPWYKRWASSFGDWFIRIGIKLGGSYDY